MFRQCPDSITFSHLKKTLMNCSVSFHVKIRNGSYSIHRLKHFYRWEFNRKKCKRMFNRIRTQLKFLKFCLVGVVNTGIDAFVFAALSVLEMPSVVAQMISYSCGVINSYQMNRRFTFASSKSNRSELLRFLAVNALTLVFTSALFSILYTDLGIHIWISKCIVTGSGLLINYIGSRLWVFGHGERVKGV
jgi:putative flippase GtrA